MNEIIWAAWLVIFLFFELKAALNKKKGDTLSETVGDWHGVPKWSKVGRKYSGLRRTALFLFLVSLPLIRRLLRTNAALTTTYHFPTATTAMP